MAEAPRRPPNPLARVALVAANAVPLVGVLALDWDLRMVMLLFWAETAVIGAFALAKLALTSGAGRWFLVPFFCLHFGLFMGVHLIFLAFLLREGGLPDGLFDFSHLWPVPRAWYLALGAMAASHGISFVLNFLGRREKESTDPEKIMGAAYKRVMLMHVAIVLGAWVVIQAGSPIWLLVLLVVVKTVLDLRAHVREHAAHVA